jgi:hypothetical protein
VLLRAGSFQQGDGVSAHGLALADGVEALAGFGLDAYLPGSNGENGGELFLHAGYVRGKLGLFEADGGIHVHDGVTSLADEASNLAEEKEAGDVAPPRGSVGEMVADIAECRGAQQRVTDGVDEGVAIRVAQGAFVERNVNAAQNQFPPARGEAMHIVAYTNAVQILNSDLGIVNCLGGLPRR